jgi:hypothetical protein
MRRAAAVFSGLPFLLVIATAVFSQSADTTGRVAPDTSAVRTEASAPAAQELRPDSLLSARLHADHLENVSAFRAADSSAVVTYENRYYRHGATALGRVAADADQPRLAYERRLGMVVASYSSPGPARVPKLIRYPSEGAFVRPPSAPPLGSTRRSVDLLIGPLFTYDLARIFSPNLIRLELQPELRYNPWPGGRARVAVVVPVHNDFQPDSLNPDLDRVRPGPVMFEQFGWARGAALVSACGGLFGNNRYGMSFGLARPLRGGEWLLDSQADVTGFFATSDSGFSYSTMSRWTGFVGVGYRPPGLDFNIRLRAERFLQNDKGFELEVRRSMGDVDLSLALQRVRSEASNGLPAFNFTNGVVRLTLPLPPHDRRVDWPVRVLPVERFSFSYREESEPIGQTVANLTSREDFLRQTDVSSMSGNRPRYDAGYEDRPYRRATVGTEWVSLNGMTGFVKTPWAGVMGDKQMEFGYNKIPKEAADQYRDIHSNEIYYGSLGFLPHVEVGLRWTVMPGGRPFADIVPESKAVDHDRMFSARVEILRPESFRRPGLAVGVEDARGTRRFHSSYVVTGVPFDIYRLQNRVTLGYAPRVFEASHYTLDGLFGAYEVSAWQRLSAAVEYDTEKLNGMLGINLGYGFRARVAALDLKHMALGAGWFKAL